MEGRKEVGKAVLKPEKGLGKQLGRVVGPYDGEPEDPRQQGDHDGVAGGPTGEKAVQRPVGVVIGFPVEGHHPAAQPPGGGEEG